MLVLIVALFAAGCACGTPVAAGPASASYCAAPQMAAQVAGYEIGPASYAKATLAIPGNVLVCIGNAVRCITDALLPAPVPTPVYAPAAAPLAEPCAEYAPAFEAQAACAESVVEEPYTVRVPVQSWREETRVRRYKVETYQRRVPMPECAPAPQAAPQFAPCDPPPPPSGSSSDKCPSGCCEIGGAR